MTLGPRITTKPLEVGAAIFLEGMLAATVGNEKGQWFCIVQPKMKYGPFANEPKAINEARKKVIKQWERAQLA